MANLFRGIAQRLWGLSERGSESSIRSDSIYEPPAPPKVCIPTPNTVAYVGTWYIAPPLPPPPPGPYDAILIDISKSMGHRDYPPTRLGAAKKATREYIAKRNKAEPGAHIGVVTYSSDARIISTALPVSQAREQIQPQVDSLQPEYQTDTAQGLRLACSILPGMSHVGRRRIILLTDGFSNLGEDPEEAASQIKSRGIEICIIGIGAPKEINEGQLRRMASVVNGELQYWFIGSAPDLIKKFEALALREFK